MSFVLLHALLREGCYVKKAVPMTCVEQRVWETLTRDQYTVGLSVTLGPRSLSPSASSSFSVPSFA